MTIRLANWGQEFIQFQGCAKVTQVPQIANQKDRSCSFSVTHTTGAGGPRAGFLVTPHGSLETPCFLPVASHGDLRTISFEDAAECGTRIIMANGWHVYRRFGEETLQNAGGVHRLLNWGGAVFTDSGGYQVFSLRETATVTDEGVAFRSLTGDDVELLRPEDVVEIQKQIGSDIMTALDECPPYPCSKTRARSAMRRTNLWARRSMNAFRSMPSYYAHGQDLWGIVQGGVYEDLRKISVEELVQLDFGGYGIGGLSIGMPRTATREMTKLVCDLLPSDKPRHLLGTGLPCDILEGIEDGVDTFDCVLPLRKAERGVAYTRSGEVRYKDSPHTDVASMPLDSECSCQTCKQYSREELRHLYRTDKARASHLAAIHNLYFYHDMLAGARKAIRENRFSAYKEAFFSKWFASE